MWENSKGDKKKEYAKMICDLHDTVLKMVNLKEDDDGC